MDTPEKLAEALEYAARIREESWNGIKYDISIAEAAEKGSAQVGFDTRMDDIITMLLTCSWNSSLAWAKDILN